LSDRLAPREAVLSRRRHVRPCSQRPGDRLDRSKGKLILMVALPEPVGPRGWVDYAKDFAIMIAISAAVIALIVFLKQVLPPIG
jgi:hypothetical protein